MCGRYSLEARAREVAEAFDLERSIALEPRYNIAPTQEAPIVRLDRETGARELSLVHWGLTPRWADGRLLINARSETIATRPVFREAFRRRRCLVPATGFFEWQKLGGAKQPFHFRLAGSGVFAFAGVWDRFFPRDAPPREGYVILTTRPNGLAAPIHDRMPVILSQEMHARWLDPDPDAYETLEDLLVPAPEDRMEAFPVSTIVNSAANDEPACVRRLEGGAGEDGETLWGRDG